MMAKFIEVQTLIHGEDVLINVDSIIAIKRELPKNYAIIYMIANDDQPTYYIVYNYDEVIKRIQAL